jgi:hypothetical protein
MAAPIVGAAGAAGGGASTGAAAGAAGSRQGATGVAGSRAFATGIPDTFDQPAKVVAGGLAALLLLLLGVIVLPAVLIIGVLGGGGGGEAGGLPSAAQPFMRMYADAGVVFRVNPYLLMSVHEQETDYGTSTAAGVTDAVNFAGCCAGPMQFAIVGGASNTIGGRGGTWATYARSYRRAHLSRPASYPNAFAPHPNVYDSYDAIYAAAAYFHALGAGPQLDDRARQALVIYSGGSPSYAEEVLARAQQYESASSGGADVGGLPWLDGTGGQAILAPGADRPGVPTHAEVLTYVQAMSALVGQPLTITTGSNHSEFSGSGQVSEHWTGWAADLGSVANHFAIGGTGGTRIAAAALVLAGVARAQALAVAAGGGLHDAYFDGWRVQVIWRATGHYDHVHVGLKAAPGVPDHLETSPY